MRRSTHLMTGMALGITFAPDALSGMAAVMGSLCPDWLDVTASFGNRDRWSKIHRTWSHNQSYWAVALVGLVFAQDLMPGWGFECLTFFWAGAALHIVLDCLTPMGIPVIPLDNKTRFSVGIIKTNSILDILLGLLLLMGAIGWRLTHGGFPAWFGSVLTKMHGI